MIIILIYRILIVYNSLTVNHLLHVIRVCETIHPLFYILHIIIIIIMIFTTSDFSMTIFFEISDHIKIEISNYIKTTL